MPGKLDWSGVEEGLEFVGASHQEIDARQSSATIECSISANPASVFPIVSNLISSYCLEAMLVCGIVGNFHSNCRLDRGGCNLGKHGAARGRQNYQGTKASSGSRKPKRCHDPSFIRAFSNSNVEI